MDAEAVMWTRFSDLVVELRDEEGGVVRGWQSRVAKRLGMDRSYFAKLLSGERMLGWAAAQRISEAVGMRAAFFADERHGVSWREYQVGTQPSAARQFVEAGVQAADAGRFPVEPPDHPAKPHARWALDLYRECQRDAEGDPWHEPGGAERRFITRLREYAGAE